MGDDKLLSAFLRALDDGVTQAYISRETGVPKGSLRQFKNMGALGAQRRDILQRWLDTRGYFQKPTGSYDVIATRLRGLLAIVESDAPDREKKMALSFEVELLRRSLKQLK